MWGHTPMGCQPDAEAVSVHLRCLGSGFGKAIWLGTGRSSKSRNSWHSWSLQTGHRATPRCSETTTPQNRQEASVHGTTPKLGRPLQNPQDEALSRFLEDQSSNYCHLTSLKEDLEASRKLPKGGVWGELFCSGC